MKVSMRQYCEGLEQALMIVNDCTIAGLKELATKRASQASPGAAPKD